jgi:hypothetical protein
MADDVPRAGSDLPELVFVPAHPVGHAGTRQVGLELRRSRDGRPVLPVVTTLPGLVAVLGVAPPWVLMPLRAARAVSRQGGADEVVLDPTDADERTRWTPADLDTLRGDMAP